MQDTKLTLRWLIEAVEDNSKIYDGSWKDWSDADHIIAVYSYDCDCDCDGWECFDDESVTAEQAREILNRAIASNGDSLREDLSALEA